MSATTNVRFISITKPEIEIDGKPLTPEGLIAYCARVSSPNQENPEYAKLLSYCIRNDHWCYDKDTEVLTEKGFIPFVNLTKDIKVAAYDLNTQSIKYENPLAIYADKYTGEMISFETFTSDLLVTPNHRMLGVKKVQHTNKTTYKDFVGTAEEFFDTSFAIRSAIPSNLNEDMMVPVMNSNLFLEFIGFFIGDGSCKSTRTNPEFHLKLERKITYLKELCKKLNLNIKTCSSDSYVVEIKGFKDFALSELYTKDGKKTIPTSFYNMSTAQFSYLMNGLMESDGYQNSRKTNTLQYSTASDSLANAIQTLAILNGFSSVNKVRKRNDGYYLRDVYINTKQYTWVDKYRVTKHGKPKRVNYDDYIYCCSVSTGMIVVRRNNKISISGNSVFEQVHMSLEITTTRAIAAQILRHNSLKFQEFSLRYTEALDYIPCEPRRQDLKNRQNSIDDMSESTKEWFLWAQQKIWNDAKTLYDLALKEGIAKECARMILPLNTQTRMYMTGSVRSWIHYLQVRCDVATQKEHRDVANMCKEIFVQRFPIVAEALDWNNDYQGC